MPLLTVLAGQQDTHMPAHETAVTAELVFEWSEVWQCNDSGLASSRVLRSASLAWSARRFSCSLCSRLATDW